MSDSSDVPGPLIASGRAADVFDLGDGTVLRRYRRTDHDLEYEARVMRHVASEGVRVPGVVAVEGSTDLVMERIDGPTMLDDLRRRQWMLLPHARRLARIQARLAEVAAPSWMLAPGSSEADDSASVLHLDLHPMNVILGKEGPVIIDWTNAAGGPPGFDAALSYVEITTFETGAPDTDPRSGPNVDELAKKLFASTFRRMRGRRLVDPFLVAACDHRLSDPGITPGERVGVADLRKDSLARRRTRVTTQR